MYDCFQAEATLASYEPLSVEVDITAVNAADAWGAKLSAQLDFTREDAADDLLLNDIVWRSVRGEVNGKGTELREVKFLIERERHVYQLSLSLNL